MTTQTGFPLSTPPARTDNPIALSLRSATTIYHGPSISALLTYLVIMASFMTLVKILRS